MSIDALDRQIITATQGGLPLVRAPYAELAGSMGISEAEFCTRMQRMQNEGIIRRVGIAPNHYKLGLTANGMSVWDVADARIAELGEIVGNLDFVTHCYERPRNGPDWPYNLFAMLHGRTRDDVERLRAQVADILGDACRGSDILYSTRILKKTGLRLRDKKG